MFLGHLVNPYKFVRIDGTRTVQLTLSGLRESIDTKESLALIFVSNVLDERLDPVHRVHFRPPLGSQGNGWSILVCTTWY